MNTGPTEPSGHNPMATLTRLTSRDNVLGMHIREQL